MQIFFLGSANHFMSTEAQLQNVDYLCTALKNVVLFALV